MPLQSLESLKIRKVPKAFRALAMKHNALVDAVKPAVNTEAGRGIAVTRGQNNQIISLR